MKLSDFSQNLIGKSNKEDIVFFFFPNIPSWNKNLLDLVFQNTSSSTLDNIINISFSDKIRKNTPSTTLITNLLKLNDDQKLNNIVFKEYQKQVDRIKLSTNKGYYELFKGILDDFYQEDFTNIYYLQIIYTYLINKRYDITLFLISCMIIFSPSLKNSSNEQFEHFQNIIKFLESFTDYRKYLQIDTFLSQDYTPSKKYSNVLVCTNTQDDNARSFFTSVLDDTSCKELHIMSIMAQSWLSNGNQLCKLKNRLNDGLIVKMLVMSQDTPFYSLYTNINYTFHPNFEPINGYPNIEIKYTNIPITNRIFEDVTHNVMRVDFLTIPNYCTDSLAVFLEKDNPNTVKYYNKYSNQFKDIWNNPNYSYDIKK